MHESLNKPAGILISTQDYIQSLNSYYKALLLEIIPMTAGETIQLTSNTTVQGTKVKHGQMEGFGLIFRQFDFTHASQSYSIAFTSDTEIYADFNDKVKKNQVLAVLDTVLLKAQVIEAQANFQKTHYHSFHVLTSQTSR